MGWNAIAEGSSSSRPWIIQLKPIKIYWKCFRTQKLDTHNGIQSTTASLIAVWNTTKDALFLKVIAKRWAFWSQHMSESVPPILNNKQL